MIVVLGRISTPAHGLAEAERSVFPHRARRGYLCRMESERDRQTVLLKLHLVGGEFGDKEERDEIFEFKEVLDDALGDDETGYVDGWDFGQSSCTIYIYGPDAEAAYATIEPIIKSYRHLIGGGSTVLLWHGPARRGTRETEIPLDGGDPETRLIP